MESERFALIADIHGNAWALEAVLAEIDRQGIELIYDLGDSLHGPLDPQHTAELLQERGIQSLRGNQDRLTLEHGHEADATWSFVRKGLSPEHLGWLAQQPATRRFDDVLLCHGTPVSDTTYLLQTVTPNGARAARRDEIQLRLGDEPASLVACGHTHVPQVVRLGHTTIVNPGSIGLPMYDDDAPNFHVMASGSPHARYAIVERRGREWHVELHAVVYDWQAAAEAARALGRDDWAGWLVSGSPGPG